MASTPAFIYRVETVLPHVRQLRNILPAHHLTVVARHAQAGECRRFLGWVCHLSRIQNALQLLRVELSRARALAETLSGYLLIPVVLVWHLLYSLWTWGFGFDIEDNNKGEHAIGVAVSVWVFSITQAIAITATLAATSSPTSISVGSVSGYQVDFKLTSTASQSREYTRSILSYLALSIATSGVVIGMIRAKKTNKDNAKPKYDPSTRLFLRWVLATVWLVFMGVSAFGYFNQLPLQVDVTSRYALPHDPKLEDDGGFRFATVCTITPPSDTSLPTSESSVPAIRFSVTLDNKIRREWRIREISGYKEFESEDTQLSDMQYGSTLTASILSEAGDQPPEVATMDANYFQIPKANVRDGGQFLFIYRFSPRGENADRDSTISRLSTDATLFEITAKRANDI